jgi:hypothetical protein
MKSLEADFVKIANQFGEQRRIGYGSWRDAGVPAEVLKRAGIARTRGLPPISRALNPFPRPAALQELAGRDKPTLVVVWNGRPLL